jgi:hypothetical protein
MILINSVMYIVYDFLFQPTFLILKKKKAYDITLLSVCVSVSLYPPIYF